MKGARTSMHFTEPPEQESAVHGLKEEIDRLTKQQSEALLTATYLGDDPRRSERIRLAP